MRREYDFSQSVRNPYTKAAKKQVSLNIEVETIECFKQLSAKTGLQYQTLMNSYLTDCAMRHVEPQVKWSS